MTDYTHAHSLFFLDETTGELRWREQRGRRRAGSLAGSVGKNGYRYVSFKGSKKLAHRIVWLMTYGQWPSRFIDHKDVVKTNNAPINLRLATKAQNGANCGKRSHNSSGFKGVTWDRFTQKWKAQLQVNNQRINLGRFDDPAKAHCAYLAASQKHVGEFARAA